MTSDQNNPPGATEPPMRTPQYVTAKVMYQAVIIVSLATSLLSVFLYDRFVATKIAVLDLPGYLIKVKESWASGKMSEPEALAKIMSYKKTADTVAGSMPRNVVVISGDAILGKSSRIKVLSLD